MSEARQIRCLVGLIVFAAACSSVCRQYNVLFGVDEIVQLKIAASPSVAGLVTESQNQAHPPLAYFIIRLWRLVTANEHWLRILPSFLAAAACWFLFIWAELAAGTAAAAFTVVLFCTSPGFFILSGSLRHYGALVLFTAAALYFLERLLKEQRASLMLYQTLCATAAVLSHYSFMLLAPGLLATGNLAVFKRIERRSLRIFFSLCSLVPIGAGLLSYLFQQKALSESQPGPLIFSKYIAQISAPPGAGFFESFGQHLAGLNQFFLGLSSSFYDVTFLVILLILFFRGSLSIKRNILSLALLLIVQVLCTINQLYPIGGTRHSTIVEPFYFLALGLAAAEVLPLKRSFLIVLAVFLIVRTSYVLGDIIDPDGTYRYLTFENRSSMISSVLSSSARDYPVVMPTRVWVETDLAQVSSGAASDIKGRSISESVRELDDRRYGTIFWASWSSGHRFWFWNLHSIANFIAEIERTKNSSIAGVSVVLIDEESRLRWTISDECSGFEIKNVRWFGKGIVAFDFIRTSEKG